MKKAVYVCQQCGCAAPRWMGKCPDCDTWGSLIEEAQPERKKGKKISQQVEPVPLTHLSSEPEYRLFSQMEEFDAVVGGGIVPGSLVLVGGEPGIGKSTLLLQVCGSIADQDGKSVLYVSAEESHRQIQLRAKRLGIAAKELYLCAQTDMDSIKEAINGLLPSLVVVDSIQTVYLSEYGSAPGSVGQVRECAAVLMSLAKQTNIPILLTGHVTKDGSIAGPRVLEHLVDTVLYFENCKNHQFRILRAVKNRFGSTNEIGVFAMTEKGLEEVKNPSESFLLERPLGTSGTVVVCSLEGTRPLLLEIQALVGSTTYGNPRRLCTGLELNRALLMIAVLDKKIGLHLSAEDVYLNIAGGIRSSEPSLDLGICAAIASSLKNKVIPPKTLVFGEVGLTGEVRGVSDPQKRIREAERLGFDRCILPKKNLNNLQSDKLQVVGVSCVKEALDALFI